MGDETNSGYKIWAVDNVVYGPVELPVLVSWVQEERVSADTWVYSEATDAWKKASQFAELRMFFESSTLPTGFSGKHEALTHAFPDFKPGTLRRVKIFAGMADSDLARFMHFMEVKNVRQFTEVVRQGQPGDAMYLLLEGEVRVRLMISGKETILATLSAGDFFGEISLFDHGPRSADVVANVDSSFLRISAAAFQKMATEAPDLATPFLLAMGRTLTGRIRADNKRLRDSVNLSRISAH